MKWWRSRGMSGGSTCYTAVARTHVGKVRLVNEDRFLEMSARQLWVVADGMGGHFAGDVAATMTVQFLAKLTADMTISLPEISATLVAANNAIETMLAAEGRTGGATFAGLWINGNEAHIFWMGDSRVYRFRGGVLSRLTSDHSLVQALVDSGAIDAGAASRHPQANVVTRALGINRDAVPEFRRYEVEPGDQFLICSDGVTNELSDCEIATCLSSNSADAADRLTDLVQVAGARDNMTLIFVTKV